MNTPRPKNILAVLFVLCLSLLQANAQIIITTQPTDQLDVALGDKSGFDVVVDSKNPVIYQWLLNGVSIPDETNSIILLPKVQVPNGGSYSVVISDGKEAITSDTARLTLKILPIDKRDLFANAAVLDSVDGLIRSDNVKTSKELGEPNHNGKRGGSSIWFKWQAPARGFVRFSTAGSGFDTLLGIYTGRTLSTLVPVPLSSGGEDAGGYLTSELVFNTVQGEVYEIAVDGYAGTEGDVVLLWDFTASADLLPTISGISADQTVGVGDKLTLFYTSDEGTQGTWYFNGKPTQITGNTFNINGVTEKNVGIYEAHVKDPKGIREVITRAIRLQINIQGDGTSNPNSFTYEKFLDAADAAKRGAGLARPTKSQVSASGGLASGYTSSQIFSTLYSSKDPGEPNHCSELGGASEWYTYQPTNDGTLQINTDGSSYNTILAVYTGPGTDYASLVNTACNNASGNGHDRVIFTGKSGQIYFIAVDGVGGARGTAYLNINFGDPPLIVTPPTNQTVSAGANATFTVFASGSGPLLYRWQFNGVNILNATNPTYTVTNVQAPQTGNYTVIVSNVVQAVTSSPASLSLRTVPVITTQPTNQSVTLGSNVTFVAAATGNPAPTYQWRLGLNNLPGATNPTYTINNVQTNQAGNYSVIASNSAGTSTSANATLVVNTLPVFTTQPLSQTSNVGSTVMFTAAATGTPPIRYQWRFGAAGDVPGQTNSTFTVSNIQLSNAGNYRAVASNAAGSVMSSIAVLTVNALAAPVITQQPLTQTVTPGSSPALTVVATGNPTPAYQWLFNTTNLAGQTASSLTLNNFQSNNEGNYSVVVSNSVNSVTSSNAMLALNAPLRFSPYSIDQNLAQFQLIGIVGSNYIFQATSNLTDWSSLRTNTASNGFTTFQDTNVSNFPTRIYRAKQQ
ncbi:MAG: immunoglobulin domain-containing protein [Verrucomicrobiota bacterium]